MQPGLAVYCDVCATEMGGPLGWAGHRDGRVTGTCRPIGRADHLDKQSITMGDLPVWAGYWDKQATWMSCLHGWVGIKVRWATGMGGPPGNVGPLRIWRVTEKCLGLICQLHEQRWVPQLV